MTSNVACKECGMLISDSEYHPYSACIAYKACGDASVVRLLSSMSLALINNTIEGCARILDKADKNDSLSDLADRMMEERS